MRKVKLIPSLLQSQSLWCFEDLIVVGVPKETVTGERRVSLAPDSIAKLRGMSILIESGAGEASGYADNEYRKRGGSVEEVDVFGKSDIVLKVQPPSPGEAGKLKEGGAIISFLYPLSNLPSIRALAERSATAFAMELMPRISRAQSMDALSSQSTVAGYKAVLIAAESLPKFFPMLMTAAGTIPPARVFVLGAGVAGLQAIATARRLGAVVEGYDVRPAAKEQVASLGAKFVELAELDTRDSQTTGGYAKAQSEDFYKRQQELLAEHAASSDAVITTALVPGKKAPVLLSEDAVRRMQQGSVIVDLAAEQGGNCALTEPGKTVVKYGVTIHGPLNLPSSMAAQASQLYSRNITTFLLSILNMKNRANGDLYSVLPKPDSKDELVQGTLVMFRGEILHGPTKNAVLSHE